MLTMAELCAGYGGLHLATHAAGWPTRLVWYAENDPDASAVMAHHHPGIPNLGDITQVDWTRAEPVDILAAGYPCTDLSNAGKRAGIEGVHSGIWANVADAVRDLRPRLVLLENVAAHLARGFGRVLGDLAALRYDTSWMCIRASDLGAPHQRDRVFIIGTPADPDSQPLRLQPVPVGARRPTTVAGGDRPGALMPTPTAWLASRGSPTARFANGAPQLSAIVSALMPTPTANLGDGSGLPSADLAAARREQGRRFLDDAVALLPTPTASVADRGGMPAPGREGTNDLREAIALLPTPISSDAEKNTLRRVGGNLALLGAVQQLLPTPTATNSHGNATNNRGDLLLPGAVASLPQWDDDFEWPAGVDVVRSVADPRWAQYGHAIRRWEAVTGRPAPDPTVIGTRGGRRLSAPFVEWMMGLPAGWVTDILSNTPALRVLGNGVIPAQGAAAYTALLNTALTDEAVT